MESSASGSGESQNQKRSVIWMHFTNISEANAKSNLCKNIYSHKNGNISNLRKHLKTKHPTLSLEGERAKRRVEDENMPRCKKNLVSVEQSSIPLEVQTVSGTVSIPDIRPSYRVSDVATFSASCPTICLLLLQPTTPPGSCRLNTATPQRLFLRHVVPPKSTVFTYAYRFRRVSFLLYLTPCNRFALRRSTATSWAPNEVDPSLHNITQGFFVGFSNNDGDMANKL
ncbi:unnamed protein product [Acanthoscelides obtectus]|uniref:BED-type domain-containing protein n=1 Tax=Acanthoscelides obtectus TaxID=200917 RepID=A0A9P0Q9I4_ACAOB|nr:unnamed protein product [Acanthoscelides obtectus]CAK1670140.1 hypothetical protein AOBTE_LOCUS27429 [Acanthoscelides obtectus]